MVIEIRSSMTLYIDEMREVMESKVKSIRVKCPM